MINASEKVSLQKKIYTFLFHHGNPYPVRYQGYKQKVKLKFHNYLSALAISRFPVLYCHEYRLVPNHSYSLIIPTPRIVIVGGGNLQIRPFLDINSQIKEKGRRLIKRNTCFKLLSSIEVQKCIVYPLPE